MSLHLAHSLEGRERLGVPDLLEQAEGPGLLLGDGGADEGAHALRDDGGVLARGAEALEVAVGEGRARAEEEGVLEEALVRA